SSPLTLVTVLPRPGGGGGGRDRAAAQGAAPPPAGAGTPPRARPPRRARGGRARGGGGPARRSRDGRAPGRDEDRLDPDRPRLREVRGERRERTPSEGEPDVRVERTAEQLEVVRDDQDTSDADERPHPWRDHDRPMDPSPMAPPRPATAIAHSTPSGM